MRPVPDPPIRLGGGTLRFPTTGEWGVRCTRCADLHHVAVDGHVYPCPDCRADECLLALRRRTTPALRSLS